jgi:hypothetical protein
MLTFMVYLYYTIFLAPVSVPGCDSVVPVSPGRWAFVRLITHYFIIFSSVPNLEILIHLTFILSSYILLCYLYFVHLISLSVLARIWFYCCLQELK